MKKTPFTMILMIAIILLLAMNVYQAKVIQAQVQEIELVVQTHCGVDIRMVNARN